MENLKSVEKPIRYAGHEWNAVMSKPDARLRVAFCFPDVYELGMSYLGMQILYGLMNEQSWLWCERAFSPWPDYEALLREQKSPLTTVETGTPLHEMDIAGFSLQHDMLYTNVLAMLDLGGIPIRAKDRKETDPIVIAGGPCAFNPMPMVDFIDAFAIGEGEEIAIELCRRVLEGKEKNKTRHDILKKLASIEGIFVPSLYEFDTNRLGESFPKTPRYEGVPETITKRLVMDFEHSYYPTKPVVPNTRIVHHRLPLEIMRGCPGGCRFCHAGYTARPVRERSVERIMKDAGESLKQTGYNEASLLSLSTADYTQLPGLCCDLIRCYYPQRVALSLPSLRVDRFQPEVAAEIGKVRSTGLTFAPEAGTERLRIAINKPIKNDEICSTVRQSITPGHTTVKLYFMVGLPTETDEDLSGIVDLVLTIKTILREEGRKRTNIHVGISPFVPKPHTAYQWNGQIPKHEIERRVDFIRSRLKTEGIKVNWHETDKSLVEAAMSRGDARLGAVIQHAYENGARFDEWQEHFNARRWENAFASQGLSLGHYAGKTYEKDDILPWDSISVLVKKDYLWKEWEKTLQEKESHHCGKETCRVCQVCDGEQTFTVHAPEPTVSSQIPSTPQSGLGTNKNIPTNIAEVPTYRYRIRFSKTGGAIYLSHQDLMMVFESILRRAELELAFSQGFHPHPKIVYASALSVGVESRAEYVEITTIVRYEAESLVKRLQDFSPPGVNFDAIETIPRHTPKITAYVHAYQYAVYCHIPDCSQNLLDRINDMLHSPEIFQEFNILEADITFTEADDCCLTYTCGVEGGKYAKAERIMDLLSSQLNRSIEIDKLVRLGIFSLGRNGKLIPLIVA